MQVNRISVERGSFFLKLDTRLVKLLCISHFLLFLTCACFKLIDKTWKWWIDYYFYGYSKGPNAINVGLPPAWVDLSEEISANVQRARTKMAELAKAHAKALMPSFGDGKEDQHTIETLTHEITDLIKRSEKRLRRLSASGPSEDSNVRKNVQVQLPNSYKILMG